MGSLSEILREVPVSFLALPTRARNMLSRSGVATIADLVAMSPVELRRRYGFGDKMVSEIRKALSHYGLAMKNDELCSSPADHLSHTAERIEKLSRRIGSLSQEIVMISERLRQEMGTISAHVASLAESLHSVAGLMRRLSSDGRYSDNGSENREEDR